MVKTGSHENLCVVVDFSRLYCIALLVDNKIFL